MRKLLAAAVIFGTGVAIGTRHRPAPQVEQFDPIPEIEPGIYQKCPRCGGEGDLCLTCMDLGLIPHTH